MLWYGMAVFTGCVEEFPNPVAESSLSRFSRSRTWHVNVDLLFLSSPRQFLQFYLNLMPMAANMAAVQIAKKELRRKIQSILQELPRESVNIQCSEPSELQLSPIYIYIYPREWTNA